jgi:1,2-dihydroxy-3-keto-5-methylthiopentene dioxygenase
MSRLTIWDAASNQQVLVTEDPERIGAELKAVGVRFERWPLADLPADADAEAILAAYRPHLDASWARRARARPTSSSSPPTTRRRTRCGPSSSPSTRTPRMRVRFFHAGTGNFVLHLGGKGVRRPLRRGRPDQRARQFQALVRRGEAPSFAVVRVFTDTSGWTPHYTGTDMASVSRPRRPRDAAPRRHRHRGHDQRHRLREGDPVPLRDARA